MSLVRVATLVVGPPILVWTFASVLVRDFGRAFKYAWWASASEFDSMRRAWRSKSFDEKDWI